MLAAYIAVSVLLSAAVAAGLLEGAVLWPALCSGLGGAVVFLALVRSGLSARFERDPAMTQAQVLWALVALTWTYAAAGPARAALLPILLLILMLATLALGTERSRPLAMLGFVMLASAMIYLGWRDPQRYDPRLEAAHLGFTALAMVSAGLLTSRMARLRHVLEDQRHVLAEALHRIQTLATRDELTGLLNRRALLEGLRVELRRRSRQPLAIAWLDVDAFRETNQRLGRTGGDHVLQGFAEAARDELRAPDLFARWDGDSFVLAMPDTSLESARRCLERLHRRAARLAYAGEALDVRLSFCAGLTDCKDEPDLEDALQRAESALQQARRMGPGQVNVERRRRVDPEAGDGG